MIYIFAESKIADPKN